MTARLTQHDLLVLTPPPPRAARLLPFWLALGVSVLLHAGAIKTHFIDPLVNQIARHLPLEVVLVNAKHNKRPTDPTALAQANLDGGGNTDQNRTAKTPLPPQVQEKQGDALSELKQKQQALEQQNQRLLEQIKQSKHRVAVPEPTEQQQPQPVATLNGVDLYNQSLAIARKEAQISKDYDDYQKKPRHKYITARTAEARAAFYYAQWVAKVERVGELNYPTEAARQGIYGSVKLGVSILANGELESVEMLRSSGKSILDDAAKRILYQANPFSKPSADLLDGNNRLYIVSTVTFTNTGRIEGKLSD